MPKRILVLYSLVGLQLAAYLLVITLAFVSVRVHFEQDFGKDLQTALCDYVGVESVRDFGNEEVGSVIGKVIVPLTLLLLVWLSVGRRHRLPLATFLFFLMLIQVGQGGWGILSLLCLVLLFLPGSSRIWRDETPISVAADSTTASR